MKKSKILIVEDEIIAGMALCTKLDDSGYHVCPIASTGEEAIRIAEEEKPDLMLMDISIRGEMGGIEAASLIRNRLGVPVIFVTGYPDQVTRNKARIVDPAAYLVKPLDYEELLVTIEGVISPSL
ncbi:MAG: response regulator [Planctomycetota bacterium]